MSTPVLAWPLPVVHIGSLTVPAAALASAAAAAVLGVALTWLLVRRRRTSAGPPTVAYDEHDQLHVDLTGVPASNADLGHDPRTGQLHLRDRRKDPADADTPPVARATPPTATATDPDQPLIPDLPPGANTTAQLPTTAASDPVAVLLDTYAIGDPGRVAAVAAAHPDHGWAAHLLAATIEPNPAYAQHLHAAADSHPCDDLPADVAATLATARLPVPLPTQFACAYVPADIAGLRIAALADDLAAGSPDHEQLLASIDDQTAPELTLLLAADAALHGGLRAPVLPRRRNDQWGLLYAHTALRVAEAAGDIEQADRAAAAAYRLCDEARRNPALRVDVAALRVDVTVRHAAAAYHAGDPDRAHALLAPVAGTLAAAPLLAELERHNRR